MIYQGTLAKAQRRTDIGITTGTRGYVLGQQARLFGTQRKSPIKVMDRSFEKGLITTDDAVILDTVRGA